MFRFDCRRFVRSVAASLFVLEGIAAFQPPTASAQQIQFIEQFALAPDRAKTLEQLVPGTEDYFYFHALHFQLTEQFSKVDEILKPWIERFGETQRVKEIKNRQALILYSQDPQKTLEYLKRELNLNFSHQRQIPPAERNLPSALDPEVHSAARLMNTALRQHGNTDGIEDRGLVLLSQEIDKLNRVQRRHLLSRLQLPDFPGLMELLVDDFKQQDRPSFGAYTIHNALTLAQLDELATQIPDLRNDANYVNLYCQKLFPSDDVNPQVDRMALRDYLDRVWKFAADLSPSFNSLKASIRFHQLALGRAMGAYDRELFIEYLKLPRQVWYINPKQLERVTSGSHFVDLGADYQGITRLPPISNEEVIVLDYLHHFLLDAEDTSAFAPYFEAQFLRKQLATVKVLNGLGDVKKWTAILSPEEYQALLDRVDIEFAPNSPQRFGSADPVALQLRIKNVKSLIVKVFEINTENFYRQNLREMNTDINLDGLVPNWQKTIEYDSPPALQVARDFTFPTLDHAGVYIIDFIGNGKSSRALVRKGQLTQVSRVTPFGHEFTVMNEAGEIQTKADVWLDGRRFLADEDGKIRVPFSTQPNQLPLIIRNGSFCCLDSFAHAAEDYQLLAGFHVDRESLLRMRKAQIVVRPSLRVAGTPIPLEKRLEKIRVRVTATNHDGNSTIKTFDNLELNERGELVVDFQSPPRLNSLSLELMAEVRNQSKNETQSLVAGHALTINQIDRTDEIGDVHLVQNAGKFLIETRGLTGELLRKQPVNIELKTVGFRQSVYASLQSDDLGKIDLGGLNDVAWIKVTGAGGSERFWQIDGIDRQTIYQTIHGIAGETIFSAIPTSVTNLNDVGLFELRSGRIVANQIDKATLKDQLLTISDLAPGDYLLAYKPAGVQISVRITAGKEVAGVFRGDSRMLEVRQAAPLYLSDAGLDENSISLRIGGATSNTRVHVFATRFAPRFNAYDGLGVVRDIEPARYQSAVLRNAYVSGREIGDEYQYILNRQQAAKYPGNLLDRPTMLLNPWSLGPTDNREQEIASGSEFGGVANNAPATAERSGGQAGGIAGQGDFSNLDFLNENTIVLANLRADEQGIVTVPRNQIGDKQHLVVVIADVFQTVQRTITLPVADAHIRDLRLAEVLPPAEHLSMQKSTETLAADSKFTINDILTARFQNYDDLADVFRLLTALNPDPQVREFQFLLGWGELDLAAKKALYSKYASHELNFFIFKKDREFFQSVVQPLLQNKYHKTFLDEWFIGDKLDNYLEPWRFNQLNVFEKVLLAQRLEEYRTDILRHIAEQYQIAPLDRAELDRLYDAAIASTLLDEQAQYWKDLEGERSKGATAIPELSLGLNLQNQNDPSVAYAQPAPGSQAAADSDRALRDEMNLAGKEVRRARGGVGGAKGDARREALDGQLGEEKSAESRSLAHGDDLDAARKPDAPAEKLDDKAAAYRFQEEQIERLKKSNEAFFAAGEVSELRKQETARFYQRIKPTEEWVESNYYRLRPEESTRGRLTINGFWLDFANSRPGDAFLSNQFIQAHRNLSEIILALALLDLPSKAKENKIEYAERNMNWNIASPQIMFHQQIRPALFDRRNTTILVSENFFQKNDRYRIENNLQYDKFITDKFSTHTLYGGQVVITNPTSTPQIVQLLIQIPQGAVAASGSQETRAISLQLPAFNSQSFEYYFYFPAAGQYQHYPAHVADGQRVLSTADALAFNVVDEPVRIDTASWEYVSQNGTEDEIVEFLGRENLLRLDLSKIAFRMRDAKFFERITSLLRERHAFDQTLWSYAVMHNATTAIREYLNHADGFLQQCGLFLDSQLVTIDPVIRRWYDQREFWPLVNIRAHQLGRKREILNSRIYEQYHRLLATLSYRKQLDSDDNLGVVYYLLLQDRIAEALDRFGQVQRNELNSQLQYDYCAAYLKMSDSQPGEALEIANRYTSYPVDHWRKRFAAISEQVAEIQGAETEVVDSDNNAQVQADAAAASESFQFEVANGVVSLEYQNLDRILMNIYEMDAELLFSRNPFTTNQQGGFSMIRPNASQAIELIRADKKRAIELPAEFRNKNILVEIVANEQSKSQAVYSNNLNVQIMEAFGQLKVATKSTGELLPKTYVKVYAQRGDGSVLFFKDGYTDLRGRFDYVTQSNIPLDGITQLAVLVLNPDHGTVIRTVGLPKE